MKTKPKSKPIWGLFVAKITEKGLQFPFRNKASTTVVIIV